MTLMTNEEKRVIFYSGDKTPTNPSEVNPNTPLEELNLNWTEHDLPERVRTKHVHRLHPYLGKYIPQLVEIFLRKYFIAGQTVLDPFVGSGTTLVQAAELGINAIGYDISEFNIILCRAKTGYYDLRQVRDEVLDILGKVESVDTREAQQLSLWEKGGFYDTSLTCEASAYLKQWFAPRTLLELINYKNLITDQYKYQDLLKIILSRSARSARLTTHFDLDFPKKPQTDPYWCYKHARECYPTQDALKFLRRYSLDTLKRIEEFSYKRKNTQIVVEHEDSRSSTIPKIDGVITSPPYVGLINYHEQHRYAYELLSLQDRQIDEIGSAKRGSSEIAKRKYQESIASVFCNALNSMESGNYLIVVAGDRHNLYPVIADLCDVVVESVIRRHVNRRTGRRSSEFYEDVFIWRKK